MGLIDGLEFYSGAITRTSAGRVGLIFTLQADSLKDARRWRWLWVLPRVIQSRGR